MPESWAGGLYRRRPLDHRDPAERTGQEPFCEPLRVGWGLGLDPVCTAGWESAPGAFRVDERPLHSKPFLSKQFYTDQEAYDHTSDACQLCVQVHRFPVLKVNFIGGCGDGHPARGVLKQEVIRELETSQDSSEFYCGVVVFATPL